MILYFICGCPIYTYIIEVVGSICPKPKIPNYIWMTGFSISQLLSIFFTKDEPIIFSAVIIRLLSSLSIAVGLFRAARRPNFNIPLKGLFFKEFIPN